jgi:hypothetical protein
MNILRTIKYTTYFILTSIIVVSLAPYAPAKEINDMVFIHHSSGENWLNSGLHDALLAKDYIDERNDITYGTVLPSDPGRPASLGDVPGDNTNMNHWILWFNDYLEQVKRFGSADGTNRIVMFKSCFPISDVWDDGTEPGDPFGEDQTLANYKAVYRHPDGPGRTYSYTEVKYVPLEDIFSKHPEILFIPVTAPPLVYGGTDNANAHRARLFNNWLKTDWLASYNKAHPGLMNVAVFDWFNFLANPDNALAGPNRLKAAYGGTGDDSHPSDAANAASTVFFATSPSNFLDAAWLAFSKATTGVDASDRSPAPSAFGLEPNYPNPFNASCMIPYRVKEKCRVTLSVFDIHGRLVADVVDSEHEPGVYRADFDGTLLPSGIYIYRIRMKGFSAAGKMIMTK